MNTERPTHTVARKRIGTRCRTAVTNVGAMRFQYTPVEHFPVEVLTFEMDPDEVPEFLRIDHEVWTLGEAVLEGFERIPFLSKEVWLDEATPGRVTLVFVWESMESWERVAETGIQQALQRRFDELFGRQLLPVEVIDHRTGPRPHRWSRFDRLGSHPD